MADECVLVFETELPVPFTVADGTGIPKGTILKLTTPMTAIISSGDGDPIAGIAAEEKVQDDGKVTLGVYMGGIFKGKAGVSTIIAGEALDSNAGTASNEIADAPVTTGARLGYSLSTPGDNDTFLFRLHPHWQSANS